MRLAGNAFQNAKSSSNMLTFQHSSETRASAHVFFFFENGMPDFQANNEPDFAKSGPCNVAEPAHKLCLIGSEANWLQAIVKAMDWLRDGHGFIQQLNPAKMGTKAEVQI